MNNPYIFQIETLKEEIIKAYQTCNYEQAKRLEDLYFGMPKQTIHEPFVSEGRVEELEQIELNGLVGKLE
jgi:hypothetical protein